MYDLGAAPYFDAAAGKPYGYYTGPADRLADPAVINFSRFTLLRQVMEKNGDAHKLLWGGNFGWNSSPASVWGYATPDQQRDYTLAALRRAAAEWPWAGPLALENYQPNLPPEDAHWGFALVDSQGKASPLADALSPFSLSLPPAILRPRIPMPITGGPGNFPIWARTFRRISNPRGLS